MDLKPVKYFHIHTHGVHSSHSFNGHALWGTSNYTACATGIGHTELEALEDALEQLAHAWDVTKLAGDLDFVSESASLSAEVPWELKEASPNAELWVHVSIDVG